MPIVNGGKVRMRVTIEVDVDLNVSRKRLNMWVADGAHYMAFNNGFDLVYCATEMVEPATDEVQHDKR